MYIYVCVCVCVCVWCIYVSVFLYTCLCVSVDFHAYHCFNIQMIINERPLRLQWEGVSNYNKSGIKSLPLFLFALFFLLNFGLFLAPHQKALNLCQENGAD